MKIRQDFEMLREHLIIIRQNYNTYNDLFFSGNDDILIKTASTFFNDISEIMLRDWILQVCKIMDSAETKKGKVTFENITIKLIDKQLRSQNLMCNEVELLSQSILCFGEKLLPARNKRLAHFDREHQVKSIVLGLTSKAELLQFLDDIQKYTDEVGNLIGVGTLDFSSSGCQGDVLDLIKVLREFHELS